MFNNEVVDLLEKLANRPVAQHGGTEFGLYKRGVDDGMTKLAQQIVAMSVPVVATTTGSSFTSNQNITEGVANNAETVLQFVPDVANVVANKPVREVECIGVCESTERFVSETPSDGSILDTVGDSLGNIAEGVGDVVGGAFSAVGDVISSIAD